MNKTHLPQITLFNIDVHRPEHTANVVNNFIKESFDEHGSFPVIRVSSTHIVVINSVLCNTER